MSKKSIVFVFGLLFALSSYAQKIAIVNTDAILNKMPEYEKAQEKLDALSKQYQTELNTKKEEIKKMYKTYQADKILLSEELRKQREAKIKEAEEALEKLTQKRFGAAGDLYKERQKLVKPIQDKVYNAISKALYNYDLVIDISSDLGILYYKPKLDKTDKVEKELGI